MTDQEFDVLDELYFVQTFNELEQKSGYAKEELIIILKDLLDKNWVRVLYKDNPVKEEDFTIEGLTSDSSYMIMASKEGLLAHNGR